MLDTSRELIVLKMNWNESELSALVALLEGAPADNPARKSLPYLRVQLQLFAESNRRKEHAARLEREGRCHYCERRGCEGNCY